MMRCVISKIVVGVSMMRDYGTPWSEIETKIISEIDATFDTTLNT